MQAFNNLIIELVTRYQVENGYDITAKDTADAIEANYHKIQEAFVKGIHDMEEAEKVLGMAWGRKAGEASITANLMEAFKTIWPPKAPRP